MKRHLAVCETYFATFETVASRLAAAGLLTSRFTRMWDMHGGVVRPANRGRLVMLAALYYEPLWIFYRDRVVHPQFDELRYMRLAVGPLRQQRRVQAREAFARESPSELADEIENQHRGEA